MGYLFSKDFLPIGAKGELENIKKVEREINRDDLIYIKDKKKNSKTCDFNKFETIRSFGREICNCFIMLVDAFEQQKQP